jgi:hypothetical protein
MEQEIRTNKMHIFLTNSKSMQEKTLVTKNFHHHSKRKGLQEIAHHFTPQDNDKP